MNESTKNENDKRTSAAVFRPQLTFYHPNARGTGCAASFDLHPAHDRKSGCVMMKIAAQMTVGDRKGPKPVFPRFDWDGAVSVKLGFDDLCRILQVLRGECESIDDGHGLYHTTSAASTRINLRHILEPVAGYSLEVYRTARNGQDETRLHLLFSTAEALGLCEAISGSMAVICFGIPVVLPHDVAEYEERERGFRNGTAA